MTPRDWFSVGIRLLGVWIIYDGFTYLLSFLSERLNQLSLSELARERAPIYYLVFGIGSIAFGSILVLGAERLTRWAFEEAHASEEGDTASTSI